MIVFDATKCTGCMACQMACMDQRDIRSEKGQKPLRRVIQNKDTLLYQSIGCIHCGLCMKVCPMECYRRNELGYVVLDAESCISCHACEAACPRDVISFTPMDDKAVKCDGCSGRIEAGLLPACVHTCPTGALILK